jgi:hypothetical protein
MTEPETPDIDRRLREVYGDDEAAAGRVARAALAEEDSLVGRVAAGSPRRWAAVAAGAGVLLVASALVWWPARTLQAPVTEPAAPPTLSGVITDGALVVSMPDGSVLISAGQPRTDRLPDGFSLVILEGVPR